MWKEPDIATTPADIKLLLKNSVYWNKKGNLTGSSKFKQIQYLILLLAGFILSYFIVLTLFSLIISNQIILIAISSIFEINIITISSIKFYNWGWKETDEAWYNFDNNNDILTVIKQNTSGWETIEIPYEEIDHIEYVDGEYGKAIIKSGPFEIETNRATEKRESSVTEMWDKLARTEANMIDWPIKLVCQKCNREFGHHIGTAKCPFCGIILIDPKVKGRIDPISQHPFDLDRI